MYETNGLLAMELDKAELLYRLSKEGKDHFMMVYIHHPADGLTFEQWLNVNRIKVYEKVLR